MQISELSNRPAPGLCRFMTLLSVLLLWAGFALSCKAGQKNAVTAQATEVLEDGGQSDSPALRIAYSDWPGWVAWEVGIEKGFFEEAGVAVDFQWFEYVPSMDAFAAGQVDAVAITNGDALVTASTGTPIMMILLNDYSNGNDMLIAKAPIQNVGQLAGKKIGLELGFVEHLLLLQALERAGLSEDDVELINVATHQTPEVLASGDVDAIAAWQPSSGQALKAVPHSQEIFTSADVPGLIYDTLAVSPSSLAQRRADWKKVVQVWYRIVQYIQAPENKAEVLQIMSARVHLTPEEYEPILNGTYFLTLEQAVARLQNHGQTGQSEKNFDSLYGSTALVDEFNVSYDIYPALLGAENYIDRSLTEEVYAEQSK